MDLFIENLNKAAIIASRALAYVYFSVVLCVLMGPSMHQLLASPHRVAFESRQTSR